MPCMKEHPDFRNRLFDRSEEEMAVYAFLYVPVCTAPDGEVIGTLSADTPLAAEEHLRLRCSFLCDRGAVADRFSAFFLHRKVLFLFIAPEAARRKGGP